MSLHLQTSFYKSTYCQGKTPSHQHHCLPKGGRVARSEPRADGQDLLGLLRTPGAQTAGSLGFCFLFVFSQYYTTNSLLCTHASYQKLNYVASQLQEMDGVTCSASGTGVPGGHPGPWCPVAPTLASGSPSLRSSAAAKQTIPDSGSHARCLPGGVRAEQLLSGPGSGSLGVAARRVGAVSPSGLRVGTPSQGLVLVLLSQLQSVLRSGSIGCLARKSPSVPGRFSSACSVIVSLCSCYLWAHPLSCARHGVGFGFSLAFH